MMIRFVPLFAVLMCMTLLVPDGALAGGRRRRRRRQNRARGLKNGGDAFSWTCAGKDLNRFLDKSTGLDIVSQACARTGKRKLGCFVVSLQFVDVPIAVDVRCNRRKGWKRATLGNSHVRLRDASTAQIVIEGIAPSDIDNDDLKERIVTQLNRIAGTNIFTVRDIFIHKIVEGSAIITFSLVTDDAVKSCYAADLVNNQANTLESNESVGVAGETTFVNCANCPALGSAECPATTTTTTTSTTATTTTVSNLAGFRTRDWASCVGLCL
jgi:hypothetical protein